MPLATYSDLQTATANWLHRADLASYIPDMVTLAETKIFRRLRTREMETAFSGTIAAGALALPANYLDLKYIYINATPYRILERKSAKFIREKYALPNIVGQPRFIARDGSSFIFGPQPDSNYSLLGAFYKNRGPLSASAHTVFTTNPDCYLFGTLLEAAPFLKNDARIAVWQSKYEEAMVDAQRQTDREEFSGSDLRMVSM